MSKRKGIENLLGSAPAEVAPTATSLRSTPEAEPDQQHQKTAPQPKRSANKPVSSADDTPSVQPGQDLQGSPVRVQMSTSDGSEIATALSDVRNSIPPAFRKNFNLGAFLRGVLQDNDAEIAKMIREKMGDDER